MFVVSPLAPRLRLPLATVALLAACVTEASAQRFVERVYRDADGEHKYQVFVPAGYSPSRPVPAILFLHGAGERGTDGKLPTMVGLGPYAKARGASFPFLVVFPQAEDTKGRLLTPWTAGQPDAERALKILAEVQQTYTVDARRVALVGWSMGGYGAWSLGAAHPEKWSAVVAMSGGGDPEAVSGLKETPVWAFHGERDYLVPVSASREMVQALRAAGGNVAYDEFPAGGHEIFAQTFGNDGFFAWLEDPKNRPAELSTTSRTWQIEPPPFVPAVEIPAAVGIRLGNDALNALSYAAPQLVPANMLTGRLNDMFDSTSVQGRSFSVRFSGISYYGRLERVQIRALGTNRVNVQLGLRDIVLSIGGTYISGARQSAQAGPINIGIGHNRTVWLSLDVSPYVSDRQLRLQLAGVSFNIPPDSYYVTQPAGVSVQGFGMTRERVVSGLTSGLYGARYRVENEVRSIAPSIVRQLEETLTLTDPGPIVAGMWPLPVYQPRLRAYPEQVVTDANGISVVMGLAAAKINPVAGGSMDRAVAAGVSTELLTGTELGVAVAPQVLGPLTGMLVNADMARINLLDVPEKSFARLADRTVLQEIVPDLQRFGNDLQVNSELVLTAPLDVGRSEAGAQEADQIPLRFRLPGAKVEVSIKPDAQAKQWQPYARFDLQIEDAVVAELLKPTHERRVLELDWNQGVKIQGKGTFADGVDPKESKLDVDRFVSLFEESWRKWTGGGPAASSSVPDVEFAQTKLRLQRLSAPGSVISGVFDVPTIKLTNLSEEPFRYQTKGPYSPWGETYTLEPGKSHEFPIPYPLTYRHSGGAGTEIYTLYTGTHSEYRVPLAGGPPRLFTAREPAPATLAP